MAKSSKKITTSFKNNPDSLNCTDDAKLLYFACISSIAHALVLQKSGRLSDEEFALFKQSLDEIAFLTDHECFVCEQSHNNIYDHLGKYLKDKVGKLCSKLHSESSTYCRAILDTRLYLRDGLLNCADAIYLIVKQILILAERYQNVPIPIHRYDDKAKLTFGLWGFSIVEGLLDDLELLKNTFEYLGRSPIHTETHSYPDEKQFHLFCRTIGLPNVQYEYHDLETSRGKSEAVTLFSLVQIVNDLQRLSSDLAFFNVPNYGCISFEICKSPDQTTEKGNMDLLDLIQTKSGVVQQNLSGMLSSHKTSSIRFPLLRIEILQPAITGMLHTLSALQLCNTILSDVKINEKICSLNAADNNNKQISQAKEMKIPSFDQALKRLDSYQLWCREQRSQWTNLCNRLLGRAH